MSDIVWCVSGVQLAMITLMKSFPVSSRCSKDRKLNECEGFLWSVEVNHRLKMMTAECQHRRAGHVHLPSVVMFFNIFSVMWPSPCRPLYLLYCLCVCPMTGGTVLMSRVSAAKSFREMLYFCVRDIDSLVSWQYLGSLASNILDYLLF